MIMAFVKPMVKRSETEINKITGFIMGVRKFGKTTLWADMIREKFGDPTKGLLVSCGLEHGTNMIDNINTTHIDTYKDMVELKKWLIGTKGTEHDIQMICFDSAEELFTIFEQETIRRSNMENPNKQVKSIKAAYSGFTNGEKECAKLVKGFFNELYNVGIMPWAIGHTKLKTVRDKGSTDEDGFQKLGSSLIADYDSVCADCFDIIVTGLVNREIEERGSGDSTKRYVTETERRLYFRGNEIVEAGGRMKGLSVPEYIVFDKENMAKDFIDTIENALKAGRTDSESTVKKSTPKKTTKKPEPVVEEEEIAEVEEEVVDNGNLPFDIEEDFIDTNELITLDANRLSAIRRAFKEADAGTKAKVKEHLVDYGSKLSDTMKIGDVHEIEQALGLLKEDEDEV
jgi:hypothetical protein